MLYLKLNKDGKVLIEKFDIQDNSIMESNGVITFTIISDSIISACTRQRYDSIYLSYRR
ncbi:MAG: hypothetical protein IPP08_05310 [Chlorobiota bacterium]|nr:hypothetical protein [Chlorobiota bacterium]QQS67584.1 MAG: hypothetical protein IPP08_05310 [Chlorobiota bacterium]